MRSCRGASAPAAAARQRLQLRLDNPKTVKSLAHCHSSRRFFHKFEHVCIERRANAFSNAARNVDRAQPVRRCIAVYDTSRCRALALSAKKALNREKMRAIVKIAPTGAIAADADIIQDFQHFQHPLQHQIGRSDSQGHQ